MKEEIIKLFYNLLIENDALDAYLMCRQHHIEIHHLGETELNALIHNDNFIMAAFTWSEANIYYSNFIPWNDLHRDWYYLLREHNISQHKQLVTFTELCQILTILKNPSNSQKLSIF